MPDRQNVSAPIENFDLDHAITPLTEGATNLGLAVHTFSRNGATILEMVERRTKHAQEGAFYVDHYKHLEVSPINVPRLFYVEARTLRSFNIFTEKLDGAMHRPKLDPDAAGDLGLYLAELALIKIPTLKKYAKDRALSANGLAIIEQNCAEAKDSCLYHSVAKRLPDISERLALLPDVVSHNDLYWPNMAVPSDGDMTSPFILDWATASQNRLGADLHFFAEEFLKNSNGALATSFFNCYADRINRARLTDTPVSPDDLILSALSFGLALRLNWMRTIDPTTRGHALNWTYKSARGMVLLLAQQLDILTESRGET